MLLLPLGQEVGPRGNQSLGLFILWAFTWESSCDGGRKQVWGGGGALPAQKLQAKGEAVVPSMAWGPQCLPEAAFSEVLFKGAGGASFVLLCPLLISMHFLLSFGSTELLYFKFCPENDNMDESPTYLSTVACKMLHGGAFKYPILFST